MNVATICALGLLSVSSPTAAVAVAVVLVLVVVGGASRSGHTSTPISQDAIRICAGEEVNLLLLLLLLRMYVLMCGAARFLPPSPAGPGCTVCAR